MPAKRWLILSKSSLIFAMVLGVIPKTTSSAFAFTANEVVNEMSEQDRRTYLAGLVDGLAQGRWIKDKPETTGVQCVYNWYYQGGEAVHTTINQWFSRHLDTEANGLLYILIKRECGE